MRLNEDDLTRWGERIGETLRPPVFIGLQGPLGAGKSVLARAVARGAGVRHSMPSPSFNLLFRYPAGLGVDVVHVDLYRVRTPDELWELGWADLGADHELILVEWPERAGDLLPEDRWTIRLEVPPGLTELRDVEVVRTGSPPPLVGFPITVSGT